MIPPIANGYITSDYGYRNLNGVKEFHPGLDISSKKQNTPVYCVVSGKIIALGWSNPNDFKASFGLRIWIKITDTLYMVYGHLALIDSDLKVGMELYEGNQIGIMGSTGKSTAAHLHLECRSLPSVKGSHNTKDCIEMINKIRGIYI